MRVHWGMANDISTILRAALHLRESEDIHFLLVGDGKERPNLEASAQAHNLSNISFVGAVPKTDMSKVLVASVIWVAT